QWLHLLGIVPVISALREKALAIQGETMQSLERKLPHLSDRDRKVINKHTKSIINQMLKDPILQAKELASLPEAEQSLILFKKIFNLDQIEESKSNEREKSTEAFAPVIQPSVQV
ncbi:MAG TPA: glutamyl-tRNA reductase, partial [Niallia sp.]|nr:glutamyl-tRNA reductase [Niallia sp.]